MEILITGANGFVGSSLVEYLTNKLSDQKITIRCLVRKTSNVKRLESIVTSLKQNPKNQIELTFVYGDVTNTTSLIPAAKNVDLIIHCAAVLRTNNIQTYYDVNHLGTKNLLEIIRLYNPNLKCLITISSQAVAGPCETYQKKSSYEKCTPVSHYGKSKLLAETEVLKYSKIFKTIILRPGPVYGPYDKDMFLYFKYAQKGILPIFAKNFFIQFTFINDLLEVCKKIIELTINNQLDKINSDIYFVAEEKCYDINELKKIFSEVVGKKVKIFKLPYLFAYIYAFLNELIYRLFLKKPAVFNQDKLQELKHSYWLCQSSPIKDILKIDYTPLINGAKITYYWYKENKWL